MSTDNRNKLTSRAKELDTNGSMKRARKTDSKKIPFGKILSAIMKERGLTLKQVAQMAGVSLSVASDWTAGNTPRDLQAVHKLAKSLGVEFSSLLLGESETVREVVSISELFEENEMFDGLVRINIKRVSLRKKNK